MRIMFIALLSAAALAAMPNDTEAQTVVTQCAFCDVWAETCNTNGDLGFVKDYCFSSHEGTPEWHCQAYGNLDNCGEIETFAIEPASLGGSGTILVAAGPFNSITTNVSSGKGEETIRNCANMVVGRNYSVARQDEVRHATSVISL